MSPRVFSSRLGPASPQGDLRGQGGRFDAEVGRTCYRSDSTFDRLFKEGLYIVVFDMNHMTHMSLGTLKDRIWQLETLKSSVKSS